MSRNEKIKILEAIAAGRLLPDDFGPPKGYFFIETDQPGHFECNGETFNPEQFKAFNEAFDQRNERRAAIGLLGDGMLVAF